MTDRDAGEGTAASYLNDVAAALRFYSRLPVPLLPGESDLHGRPDFTRMARAVPVAGAIIGGIGALGAALAYLVGLPPLACGLVAVGLLALATGAFHEDGLADTADGFGGGVTVERKLEIMKDSRIGTYGTIALIVVVGLRAALVAEILTRDGAVTACAALVASGAVSRTAALWLGYVLAPARPEGAAFAAGRPSDATFRQAVVIGGAIALVLVGSTSGIIASIVALAAAALVAFVMARVSAAQIGGQTGDVAGATQQLAEAAIFLTLVIALR